MFRSSLALFLAGWFAFVAPLSVFAGEHQGPSSSGGGHVIQDEGVDLAAASRLDMTGAAATCSTTGDVTTCDFSALGGGDVAGPAASTDSELPLFSLATGKALKRSNTLSGFVELSSGVVAAIGSTGTGNVCRAGSPTFTGTVTIPTPFTLGAVSVLPTGTELNFVDGVTSGIQGQLDAKAPLAGPLFTGDPRSTTAPAADDSDTSLAPTSWVQGEIAALPGAGLAITGGVLRTDSNEEGFLADGGASALTCGAGTGGKMRVRDDGKLDYCDGAGTPALRTFDPLASGSGTIGGTLGTTPNAIPVADGAGGVTAKASTCTIDAGVITCPAAADGSRRHELAANTGVSTIGAGATGNCSLGFVGASVAAATPQYHCNGGSLTPITYTIASGAEALATSAITSEACSTADTAISATGVATTDTIQWTFNGDPTAVTGYAPVTAGGLSIFVYPTANAVNFKVCNPTASSITPGAVTLNWRVVR